MADKGKEIHKGVYLGITLLLSLSLIIVMAYTSLQKRLPFVLMLVYPFIGWKCMPYVIPMLKGDGRKSTHKILRLSMVIVALASLLQFTCLPFVQHRIHIELKVMDKGDVSNAERLRLLGIGNEGELLQSSLVWNDFDWNWNQGARNGRIGQWGDTAVFTYWRKPFLYFDRNNNSNTHVVFKQNRKEAEITIGDYVCDDGLIRVPLKTDSWAFVYVTLLFYLSILLFSSYVLARISLINSQGGNIGKPAVAGLFLFVILLYTPLSLLLLNTIHFDPAVFEESEKREPQNFTLSKYSNDFMLSLLEEIPKDIELWFNDHFGLRDQFIQLYSAADYLIMGETFIGDRVIAGKNGFLFVNDTFQKVISKHRGLYKVSDKRKTYWVKAQESRRKYLDDRDISFAYMIAPNKHSVYPEYLPAWANTMAGKSFTDQLLEGLSLADASFSYIDAREGLIDAKSEWGDLLYGKTDTHWTFLGAYVAYRELIDGINRDTGWDIPLIEIKDIEVEYLPSGYHLTRMLKLEKIIDFDDHLLYLEYEEASSGKIYQITEYGNASEVDPFFRVPWQTASRIMNDKPLVDKRVLIFRDSMASQMSPLLNETFKEVLYIHYNQGLNDFEKHVEDFEPDLVIIETGERGMNTNSIYKRTK